MKDDIFDVVNDRDEPMETRPRREVHRLGLKHRAVHVLITNASGEVFLQKRSMQKDTSPGLWDSSSSGHLDAGEGYDDCSIREVREELGVTLAEPPVRLFKIKACSETGQEFVWVYHSVSEGPFTLDPEEIETGGWFSVPKITRWTQERPEEFAPAFLLIWRMLEQRPERWEAFSVD